MKNKLFILFGIILMALSSCQEEITIPPQMPPPPPPPPEVTLDKKGVGMTFRNLTWSTRLSRLKIHWHYSWGPSPRDNAPANVDYVPMFWGKGSVNDENINNLKQLASEGKIQYILGFNEPDGVEQANMTVDEAIALWPRLEEVGVPLGSPATVSPTNDWFVEFMQKAQAQNLRIDFITVHSYGGVNAEAFLNKVKQVWDTYQKPIWVTEFAVADWDAATPQDNRYSPNQVLSFMQTVLPELYDREYVERFAWFNGDPDSGPLSSSALFDKDDNLTTLGAFYSSFRPNDEIGAGSDPEPVEEDPDNILVNGTFETGAKEPWAGFKSGTIELEEAHTGRYVGRIQNNDGSLFQLITLEEGKTYELSFFSKWASEVPNTFNMLVRQEGGDKTQMLNIDLPKSADWTETKAEFTVPAGITSTRVLFFKPKDDPTLPPFFLDDIVLKEKQP